MATRYHKQLIKTHVTRNHQQLIQTNIDAVVSILSLSELFCVDCPTIYLSQSNMTDRQTRE
jgi:hypothetical protein